MINTEKVKYLRDILRPEKVAYLAGTHVGRVHGWTLATRWVGKRRACRLSTAYKAASIVSFYLGEEIARCWFDQPSSDLGGRTPAKAIREVSNCDDQTAIVKAARNYALREAATDPLTGSVPKQETPEA